MVIAQSVLIGVLVSTADPIFYDGFFGPLVSGAVVNWASITFKFLTYIPWNIIAVFLAGIVARRIAKVLG